MAVITLTSDFGWDDEFVGVMKGVILAVNPFAQIVDITHQIAPQDLMAAAYRIQAAYRFFPKDTVHVVVVDPGVGSSRAIVALRVQDHTFVAPDNGVLSLVIEGHPVDRLVNVTNDRFFLKPLSDTFHGRDIMAPVAAHLSRGTDLGRLGPALSVENLTGLPMMRAGINAEGVLEGSVILSDHFGNLITNIDTAAFDTLKARCKDCEIDVMIAQHRIRGLSRSYADVPPHQPLAIMGSKGLMEIAVNCGRADSYFKAAKGDTVYLSPKITR